MMELTCAVILISASLVLATPHGYGGYGVKGGASARAESSASAGAFGGVPVAVPLGAGYSGSYSKSSSSNSASSSASSSSSSSSFSYSGSGAGGFELNGGAPGHEGCSSGNCQTAGSNGMPAPHGSSAQGYNSANAAAAAGAGVVSGSGCQGLSCDGNSEKCTSGQCKPNLQTGTPSIDSDSNKCTSGQCGSALQSGASLTDYGSNDIRAVTESSDSAHNANHQSSGIDKTSSASIGAGSDCSLGKCGSSGPSSSKPNSYGHNSGNSYQGSSASNNQQTSSSDTGITTHYQKPSPHLETPKLVSKCNSGNCNAGPHEPGHETSPSSYNVPIHGAYDKGEPQPSCDGVKCENQPKGPYSPTDNAVTKEPSSFDYPSSTNCAGASCFVIPANQVTGGPSLTVTPGNVNLGNSPSHVPTMPAVLNIAPGHIGHGKLPNDKLPPYTGGFGGPAGILSPNEYVVHAPATNPSYGHASTPQNEKPLGSAPTGCNSPSCSGYPSASGPIGGPVSTGTYNHLPGGDIPSEKLPPYTGGFGGPTGTLKPNEFDVHATVTNKPTFAHPGSPSYNTQSPVGNIGTPGCQAGKNCGGYSPTAGATSGAAAPSGYYGTSKPNNGINSPDDKQPTYTGGFGGPGGLFNPDKHDIHSTGPSSPGYTPSGTYNSPTSSDHPGGCKTLNCYPSLGSTAAANAQAESFGVTKPNSGPHFSSVTLPAYSSGYDSPSGGHRPNEISGPASTPSFAYTQSPSSPGSYSPGCKTGNCANYPSGGPSAGANAQPGTYGVTKPNTDVINPAGATHPQYTGGFGGPSGTFNPNEHNSPACKTGNCANSPSSGPSASANAQPGSYGITKPNTDVNPAGPTHPQYTGGFGGPSGTFNPNEHNSPGCKTGNCGNSPSSGPSAGANSQPGSYGITNPNTDVNPAGPTHPQYTGGFGGPSGTFNPNKHNSPGCKTGNCANYPITGPSAGADVQPGSFGVIKPNADVNPAAPTHPQHTGGSGGTSGTFKPNENTYVTSSPGSASTNCKTPNCVGSPTASAEAISGANAQSGSYGITKPSAGNNPTNGKPIYTGGFGGATGLLKPNEFTIPAVSPTPNNKPTGTSPPAACTSGNCNPQTPHGSAPHSHNGASSVAHATAAAAAEANAVLYTGGFGGPPGVLAPYDNGKIGALPSNLGQAHDPQIGGAHGSHDAKIHSQHGTSFGANSGPTGPAGAHGSTGVQAGSNAGATAYAGAAAGASAGEHGYNLHGSNYNHAGNIKGGSPCGGGCGGSGGGTYNGGSTLEVSGGHGFPKLVFSDGLNGAGSTSGATAKSLSGANAFGMGGSYASSSASAHASAGAYTKGGYGKR